MSRRRFVAYNGRLFHRCRTTGQDVLTPEERERLRRGFLKHSPRLRGMDGVGPVRYSHRGRAKGAFFVVVRGERVYLPRHCRQLTPHAKLQNLLRGSVRDQVDKVRRAGEEVDHCGVEFAALARRWLARSGVDTATLLASQSKRQGVLRLGEPYHTSWARFHAARARLRSIKPSVHREKTRRQHQGVGRAPGGWY